MNFFLIYVALPCLFYRILAKTPLEQLNNIPFVIATALATYTAFALAFAIGMVIRRGHIPESTIALTSSGETPGTSANSFCTSGRGGSTLQASS